MTEWWACLGCIERAPAVCTAMWGLSICIRASGQIQQTCCCMCGVGFVLCCACTHRNGLTCIVLMRVTIKAAKEGRHVRAVTAATGALNAVVVCDAVIQHLLQARYCKQLEHGGGGGGGGRMHPCMPRWMREYCAWGSCLQQMPPSCGWPLLPCCT